MSPSFAFSTFSGHFKGDIVTPSHPDYSAAISRWAINAERRAKYVVYPRGESDVALAIKFGRQAHLPIAIRGGGHSPSGASSSEDGLVIDLSRYLNKVEVDPDKKVAYVGGGALWGSVDKAAIEHGLASVAGTVNHTGVGGLLLGGGFGWLSPAHGLVIDNLLQATIVTADGSILTVNDDENPDLFFAIRGGGSNFGVATKFVLKLHSQRRTIYAGNLFFPESSLEKIVDLTTKWWPTAGENEAMLHVLTMSPERQPIVVVCIFYNGSEAEGRKNFKPFIDLGPIMDLTREIPYEELNTLQNPMTEPGQAYYMKGLAQRKPHFPSMSDAYKKAKAVWNHKDFQGNIIFEYFSLKKICSVPRHKTAFRRDFTPAILVFLVWKEHTEENSSKARKMTHEIADIISAGQDEVSAEENLGYSNYDFDVVVGTDERDGVEDKAKLVFSDNYPRLQQIKKKYDPDSVFRKWFPIAPA